MLSPADTRALAAHVAAHGSSTGFVPSAPSKKRKNEEFAMQCALVSWWADNCASFGIPEFLLWHTPNSAVYGGSKAQREKMGAMLKRLGQRSGCPDLFLAAPSTNRNQGRSDNECYEGWLPDLHGLFLELKAPKGIVSPEQTAILSALQQHGYQTAVCWTLEDAQKVITDYLQ